MTIPEGWKVDYSEPKIGDHIITLNNKLCTIKEIFKKPVLVGNEDGEVWYNHEWRFKCKFLDGSIMDLDPQFGSLQKIIKI